MLFKKQIAELERRLDELYDAQIRQRRMLADILYNLDEENMPAIKEIIERYKTESGENVASLKAQADSNSAAITALSRVQYEHSESIARIDAEALSDRASISLAVEHSDAALDSANDAKAAATNGASIILAVNSDGSGAQISADKIFLNGVTCFLRPEQLDGTEGVQQTVIDGGNIKTGKISAENIDADGLSVGGGLDGTWTMEKERLLFSGPAAEISWIGFDGLYYSANGATLLEIDRGSLTSALRSRNAWIVLNGQSISAGTGEGSEKLSINNIGGELSGRWTYGSSEIATIADINALREEFGSMYEPEEPVYQVETPVISPSDRVEMYGKVKISCATSGAIIHYSIRMESGESWSGTGAAPYVNVTAYTDGVDVMHVSAYATKSGMIDSDTAQATINVEAS